MEKNIKERTDKKFVMKGTQRRFLSEENILRFIAVFIIYLIVALPISLPVARADSTTPPGAVNILVSESRSPTSVYLNWTEFDLIDVPDFDHFNIYRDYVLVAEISEAEFMDTGLNADFLYRYEISAVDTFDNEGVKTQVMVTTQAPDTSTPGLFGLSIFPSSGNVNFGFSTSRETNTTIYYGINSWDEDFVSDSIYTTEHSIDLTGLDPSQYYSYRIRSCDQFGICYFSGTEMFAAGDDTTAPTLDIDFPELYTSRFLTVSGTTDPHAEVEVYTDDIFRYSIRANSLGEFTLTDVVLNLEGNTRVVLNITDLGSNSASFEYVVSVDDRPPAFTLNEIPEQTTDDSLTLSGEVNEVVDLEIYRSIGEVDTTAPGKVASLTTTVNGNEVRLDWSAITEADVDNYYVYRDGILIGESSTQLYRDTKANSSQSYTYRVAAIDDACNIGQLSDTASATLPDNGRVHTDSPDKPECKEEPIATERNIPAGTIQKTIRLENGVNILTVIVTDVAGNTARIIREIMYDSTEPRIIENNIDDYSPASYIRDVVIEGKVSEPSTITIIQNEFVEGFEKNYTTTTSSEPDEDGNYNFAVDVMLSRVWTVSGDGTNQEINSGGASWTNNFKIIATDAAGLQSVLDGKSITYKFCEEGDSDWDVDLGNAMPTEIVPRLLLDGMASYGFSFELEYLGAWNGELDHPDVTNVQVGMQPINKFDEAKFDIAWVKDGYPIVNYANGENTQGFVNIQFNAVKDQFGDDESSYIEMEKLLAEHHKGDCIGVDRTLGIDHGSIDFTGIGCVKLPMVMTITYGDGKTQNKCIDASIMITPPLDVASWIPDDFLNDSIHLIDSLLEFIDEVRPTIQSATEIATYTCLGTWALWFLTEANRLFACRGIDLEEFPFADDGKLLIEYEEQEGIKGDPQECFDALKSTENVWSLQRQVCDRVMCPSIPSFNKYVRDNIQNSDSSCQGYSQFFPTDYDTEVNKEEFTFDSNTKTLLKTQNNGGLSNIGSYCEEEYLYEWGSGCWLDNPYKKSFCKYAKNVEAGNYKARYEKDCGFGFEAFSMFENLRGCEFVELTDVAWEANVNFIEEPDSVLVESDVANRAKYGDLHSALRSAQNVCSVGDVVTRLNCYSDRYKNGVSDEWQDFPEIQALDEVVEECNEIHSEDRHNLADCYENALDSTIDDVNNQIRRLDQDTGDYGLWFWVTRFEDRPSTVRLARTKTEIQVQDGYLTNPSENLEEIENIAASRCRECQNAGDENCCDILQETRKCTYESTTSPSYGVFELRAREIDELCIGAQDDEVIINPTSGLIQSLQCICLSSMNSYLTQYYTFLSLIKNCFETILMTGDGSGGVCQQALSMYLCDIIYELVSCLKDYATASWGSQPEAQDNIFLVLGKAGDEISQGVRGRYGDANLYKALFDDKALVNSVCMFFFTGTWPLDLETIISQNTIAVDPIVMGLGDRRFQSYDTATGRATYIYTVSPMIVSGSSDFQYQIDLVCSADDSCEQGPCDCAHAGQETTMRVTNRFGDGRLGAGESIDATQYIVVDTTTDPINNAKFRYDKLRITWRYENNAGERIEESQDYNINELGPGAPAQCEFDVRSLEFRCEIFVDELGQTYFSDTPTAKSTPFYRGELVKLNEYSVLKRSPDENNPQTKWLKITVTNGETGAAVNWYNGVNFKYIPVTAEGYNDFTEPRFVIEDTLVSIYGTGTANTCEIPEYSSGVTAQLVSTSDCPLNTIMVFPIFKSDDPLNYHSTNKDADGDITSYNSGSYVKDPEDPAFRNLYYVSGTISGADDDRTFRPAVSQALPCAFVRDETPGSNQYRNVVFDCGGSPVLITNYHDLPLPSDYTEKLINGFKDRDGYNGLTSGSRDDVIKQILGGNSIPLDTESSDWADILKESAYKQFIIKNRQTATQSGASASEIRWPAYLEAKLELFHSSELTDAEPSDNHVYWNGRAQVERVQIPIEASDPQEESDETTENACNEDIENYNSNSCRCGQQLCGYGQKCCMNGNSALYGVGYCFTPSASAENCDSIKPRYDENRQITIEENGDNILLTINVIDEAEATEKISPQIFGEIAMFDGHEFGCKVVRDFEGKDITVKRNLDFRPQITGTVLRDYVASTSVPVQRGETYHLELIVRDKAGNIVNKELSPPLFIDVADDGTKSFYTDNRGLRLYNLVGADINYYDEAIESCPAIFEGQSLAEQYGITLGPADQFYIME
jgi:hypothetical protein